MKKNVVMYVVAVLAMMICATAALALPPPVPQSYGIYDAKFSTFTTAECRGCHSSGLPDRHHNLIYTKNKACLDCHTLVVNGPNDNSFADFRTCSVCHKTSPHHVTAAAAARDCKACHGPIDNPLDGHYVPTYPVSTVTPLINGRPVVDPATGAVVTVQGCAACHQPNATAIDPNTNLVRAISSNADTHHGTNLGQPGSTVGDCTWCHNFSQAGLAIRQCESCHGVKSLHNIQPKPGNIAVIPGGEPAGLGHVGNNWDCQGCHISWFGKGAEEVNPAAIIPGIRGNSYTLPADKEALLILNGTGFTNTDKNGVIYNPTVLIKSDTISLTLTPSSVTNSEIQVTVPALLQGNYSIYVSKGTGTTEVQSNVAKLIVSQPIFIKTAIASKTTITITGSFGSAPPADFNSGMGVFAGTTEGKVVSWANNKIVATVPGIKVGSQVTVKTLRGPVSAVVLEAGKKTR